MTDLNQLIPPDSGWVLVSASAINESGQIVGYGYFQGGPSRAYLLTPGDPGDGQVPAGLAAGTVRRQTVGTASFRSLDDSFSGTISVAVRAVFPEEVIPPPLELPCGERRGSDLLREGWPADGSCRHPRPLAQEVRAALDHALLLFEG